MADRGDNSSMHMSLLKIAHTLGIPPESFYRDESGASPRTSMTEEEKELLSLFRMIGRRRERQLCLDFLRAMTRGCPTATEASST